MILHEITPDNIQIHISYTFYVYILIVGEVVFGYQLFRPRCKTSWVGWCIDVYCIRVHVCRSGYVQYIYILYIHMCIDV